MQRSHSSVWSGARRSRAIQESKQQQAHDDVLISAKHVTRSQTHGLSAEDRSVRKGNSRHGAGVFGGSSPRPPCCFGQAYTLKRQAITITFRAWPRPIHLSPTCSNRDFVASCLRNFFVALLRYR